MKILVSAFVCSPYQGSEALYGWRACMALAKDHELHVITSPEGQRDLERAEQKGLIPSNVRFHFLGIHTPYLENRMLAKAQVWLRCRKFSKRQLALARKLHAQFHFDVVHMLTFTTWRVACPLWKLGIPLVWGPISGTERFPWWFACILSWHTLAFEAFRSFQGTVAKYSPSMRACSRNASRIPAIHHQAYDFIVKLRGNNNEGVSIFCNLFFTNDEIAKLERNWPLEPHSGPLRIFGSGTLEGRKGIALALRALAIVKAKGIPFSYCVPSRGPEFFYLQRLVRQLGLSQEVDLGNHLSREDYLRTLKETDIYLLPSLREGAGQTMMEAMLAGCVPIVADWAGPSEIVTEECGYRLPVTSIDEMVQGIASKIIRLHEDRTLLLSQGRLAHDRITQNYNEERFRNTMQTEYVAARAAGRDVRVAD